MTKLLDGLTRWFTEGLFHRWPWLLPAISFAAGWLGFALVQRGEAMARTIATIVLFSWPWLLAVNVLGGWLVRMSGGRLSPKLLDFVTQSLQQEVLFFALPFLVGATQRDVGQIVFTALVAAGALVSTIDPIYHRHIAAHPGMSVAFHAFCTFVASLVVLPMAAAMPLEDALPIAIVISGVWILLGLPRLLASIRDHRWRALVIPALGVVLVLLWQFRGHVPAAGLSLKNSRITQSLEGLRPGPVFKRIDVASLRANGAIAFVSIRAPTGLSQTVVFEWWHRGERLDQVTADIQGGSEFGWRTFTRKRSFPQDPRGRWRVDVLTPQGQLICRLLFLVD